MEELLYNIKNSDAQDVISIFKTIEINEENVEYIYTAMSNPHIYDFIYDISEMYTKNGIYSILYEIVDGWIDNLCNMILYKNLNNLTNKISKILINIIHSDMIECEDIYIDTLNKHFGINYYAEKMAG